MLMVIDDIMESITIELCINKKGNGVIGSNVFMDVRDQLSTQGNDFLTSIGKAGEHREGLWPLR